MVTKKTAGKKTGAKLKVKKDTIKDLDVKGKASRVKGGGACNLSMNHQLKITR